MRALKFLFVFSVLTFLFGCINTGKPDSGSAGSSEVFVFDHTAVDASVVPDSVLDQVKLLNVYFEHASVGQNIVSGLQSLSSSSSRFNYTGQSWGSDASTITTTISDWYHLNNGFGDNARGNPGFSQKLSRFDSRMRTAGFASLVDAASFKFCYIDNNFSGYASAQDAFNAVRNIMEALEVQYPTIKFFWWTMPIQTSGSAEADSYNTLVRNYCKSNSKYLLDIADIECHSPAGVKQTDAQGREILYSGYTTDGGHLNDAGNVGAVRVANAYWVLLARICGWGK